MKKTLSIIVLLVICVFFACSCTENSTEGVATLVVAASDSDTMAYEVPLAELSEGKGLLPILEYLKEKEGLEYTLSGTMLDSVGKVKNDSETKTYIYIYTSVESDFDVSEYKSEIEYEGKTLVSSGVGFDQMTVTEGAIIYIGTIVW